MTTSLRVGITGSSGVIGTALGRGLAAAGHAPIPIVRRAARDGEIEWQPDSGHLSADAIAGLDAVVNLAGAGIGDQRWTDDYRATIRSSRIDGTSLLASVIAELGDRAPGVLVSASAIGYYGDRGDEQLTEHSTGGDGFLAEVCRDWEAATAAAEPHTRVVHLRTGIVLANGEGALGKMVPLFKLGLGGRFGSGRQWMSWISIDDVVRAILHALTSEVGGPLNLTAPEPVTNREFTDALGDALRRPTVLPVPRFAPRLLLGSDLADALLFDSARVLPEALLGSGFEFEQAELRGALTAVLADG